MSDVICVHKWNEKNHFVRETPDRKKEAGWWTSCPRCDTRWYDWQPEPQVVIAKIE